jgi:hypothetical protein
MKNKIIGIALVAALSLWSHRASADYEAIAVANGGVVKGTVLLSGAKPRIKRYMVSKNPEICGPEPRDMPLVHANGDALLDAVVYLEDIARGKPLPAAAKKVTINQKGCGFEPYLSVMVNGGELEAINSDSILHNIHVYSLTGGVRHTVMNVSQPERGNIVAKRITLAQGRALKVECDAHDFMHAWVFVARNPYYAVVDGEGRFEIGDVPPGDYLVRVWHGVLGIRAKPVTVPPGETVSLKLSY